jgi:hypothetical protein
MQGRAGLKVLTMVALNLKKSILTTQKRPASAVRVRNLVCFLCPRPFPVSLGFLVLG